MPTPRIIGGWPAFTPLIVVVGWQATPAMIPALAGPKAPSRMIDGLPTACGVMGARVAILGLIWEHGISLWHMACELCLLAPWE